MLAVLLMLLLLFAGLSTISAVVLSIQEDSRTFGLQVLAASVAGVLVLGFLLYQYLGSKIS